MNLKRPWHQRAHVEDRPLTSLDNRTLVCSFVAVWAQSACVLSTTLKDFRLEEATCCLWNRLHKEDGRKEFTCILRDSQVHARQFQIVVIREGAILW